MGNDSKPTLATIFADVEALAAATGHDVTDVVTAVAAYKGGGIGQVIAVLPSFEQHIVETFKDGQQLVADAKAALGKA
jgi:Trk K+ transport system NAD-binding subunit